ncbi:PKD domain-containing protein [Pontiellaceae bacterium B12227]|nr:PKD domain-containing protein [Pontiellaceae bacterium B12227]
MSGKIKLVMAALVMAAGAAQAANISYTGTVSTAESIAGVDRLLQRDGKTATITTGGSITITTSDPSKGSLVGQVSAGEIIIDGGAFDVNSSANFIIGNGTNGDGIIDLRAGTLTLTTTGAFAIGRDAGTGVITIRGGVATLDQPIFDTHATRAGFGTIDFADKIGGGTSDGTLTITGANYAYYESLYTGDDLTYNGDNSTYSFSEVFSVSGETLSALAPPSTVASISPSTTSGYAPLEVIFDGSSSISSGIITNYFWDFGDGNTDSGVLVTNTYAATNIYTAWLTVMDDLGNTASNSVEITAELKPLELVASATPIEGEVPLDVVYDASGSSASGTGTISSVSWTFGDGNSDNGAIVSNTYIVVGTYTSEVVVVDSNGFSATNTFVIDVYPVRLVDFTTQKSGTTASDAFPASFTPYSTNDLANTNQASFLSIDDNNGGIVVAQVANINDGATGTSANDGNQVALEAEDSFTITFDTSVNTFGYDITNINTYAAWETGGGGRANQGYDVTVTYVDNSTELVSSGTYEPNTSPVNSWTAVYMTPKAGNDVIASGVKAITFSNFDEYADGATPTDVITYREFDVLGTPTAPTEIGEVTFDVLPGGLGVLSWENGTTCDVWTNASLVYPNWGIAAAGVDSPVTNAIGSEPVLFIELRIEP